MGSQRVRHNWTTNTTTTPLHHHQLAYRFPWWLSSKEPACNAGDVGLIPGLGRSPGGGHGNPLEYSCLEKPMGRGAWRATVHSVAKSQTQVKQLSMHAQLTYRASLVAQVVKNPPAMQETQVQSLDWVDPWIRKHLPVPVFLPGEFHGYGCLVGYSSWGHKELHMTKHLSTHTHFTSEP